MKYTLSLISFLFITLAAIAQNLTGRVVDKATGEAIPMATVSYQGHQTAVVADIDGNFSIVRHNGWNLTIHAVGYKPTEVAIRNGSTFPNIIKLEDLSHQLSEVVIKTKRQRYSRKNNPAVELMQRVIAAKKKTDLKEHDYVQYNKYQKLKFSLNNFDTIGSPRWAQQAEISHANGKVTLPISLDETVSQYVYRKNPEKEKTIILGEQSTGLNQLFTTGDMLNTMLKEVFSDVDIYDNYVRLLQYPFMSPISDNAIGFYRYYIQDTVYVDKDLCYHLYFLPNNQQDFGFNGDIYILADSTLHVRRCELSIPKKSDVNFVETMRIEQEYTRLPEGDWVLTVDDAWAELSVLTKPLLVTRNTRLSDYDFSPVPKKLLAGTATTKTVPNARDRDDDFWNDYRKVDVTQSESTLDSFMEMLSNSKSGRIALFILRPLFENYIETGTAGKKSKFDFGPFMSFISSNHLDGLRLQLGARTTGALNRHLFWEGFAAHGFKSNAWYYNSELTYSFNKKRNSPFEFPVRAVSFQTTSDVMSSSDRFLTNAKNNILLGIRTHKINEMYQYNRQKLSFTYETEAGLNLTASLKTESNEARDAMHYYDAWDGHDIKRFRTTEVYVGLRYTPGVVYVNTKQRRIAVNKDRPEFRISHTMGVKGFLGGQYSSNETEAGIYKRQWLGTMGYVDMHLNASAQWNKVPYMLLISPPASQTYIAQEGTFAMLDNMEMFMDRKLMWSVYWDLNGKILNRLPLINRLKFREHVAFKGIWGSLSDNNDPANATEGDGLFLFPSHSYAIDKHEPYMEVSFGLHNILKFFGVDFVHRINYNNSPSAMPKNGVRFSLKMSF